MIKEGHDGSFLFNQIFDKLFAHYLQNKSIEAHFFPFNYYTCWIMKTWWIYHHLFSKRTMRLWESFWFFSAIWSLLLFLSWPKKEVILHIFPPLKNCLDDEVIKSLQQPRLCGVSLLASPRTASSLHDDNKLKKVHTSFSYKYVWMGK